MKNDIRKKKDGKTTSAMLVGVLVCFVLIAVYGIVSQLKVSYAFPTAFDQISADDVESVKTVVRTLELESPLPEGWHKIPNKFVVTTSDGKYVLDMFCLEMFNEFPNQEDSFTYTRQSTNKYIDEGISSIIISAYEKADIKTEGGKTTISLSDDDYYDAQIAIWILQNQELLAKNEITNDDVPGSDEERKTANKRSANELKTMWNSFGSHHESGHAKAIYNYVINAQSANTSTSKNSIKLDGKVELKLTDDKKYYQTDLLQVQITTAVNTEFNGFSFNIKSDNKDIDAELVDEEGNMIADPTSLTSGKFRIRLDASKLPTNSTTTLTGDISGIFKHISFKEYKTNDEDYQIALLAASTSKDESVPLKLSVTVPDTGAGFTGYIYIIGALVLIVGLTVIYVNTKVQEN